MIAILTDKPSVGKEIGRIIGATRVKNGYVEGNGYMVTWTFGNMLSLAMPKDYGTQKLERNDFPFIPSEFELMVRHTRTENGWIPEIDAVLQLKVIERVFQACDTIIAATDASRDGEMTFRYVYRKRLLNYILCIRFFIEVHSIVSASRFFHMPTYLRVVIECQSRFFPFFPAFSRNCPDYFLHTSGSSSFRSLSDLGAR